MSEMSLKDTGHKYVTKSGEAMSWAEGDSLPENWIFFYYFSKPENGVENPRQTLINARINPDVPRITARGVLRLAEVSIEQKAYLLIEKLIRENKREASSRLSLL